MKVKDLFKVNEGTYSLILVNDFQYKLYVVDDKTEEKEKKKKVFKELYNLNNWLYIYCPLPYMQPNNKIIS